MQQTGVNENINLEMQYSMTATIQCMPIQNLPEKRKKSNFTWETKEKIDILFIRI